MPKCLGIYIEDDVIKYAKLDKSKDVLKVEASSVVFFDRGNAFQTIEKIVRETFSSKDPICINVSNEIYNYFDVFSALRTADQKKSLDLDFELLCSEKGYNRESLDTRFILRDSKENVEKLKAIHIATNKDNLKTRLQNFSGFKVVSATPIPTSIYNLLDNGKNEDDNVVIVNIEGDTKVTTIVGGEIYNVNIIPQGMDEILENINKVENSMQKSYECCKNTTIYTQDAQELKAVQDNDHLEDVMPVLYKIVNEVRKIVDSSVASISRVYITGLGTAINNVDLYFQEYIQTAKCELLKPFFMNNMSSVKVPIKEYIEVNSAIALALEGLGYGSKDLNFKGKSGAAEVNINTQSVAEFFRGFTSWRTPLNAFDKSLIRILVCLIIGIIGYTVASDLIVNEIHHKTDEIGTAAGVVEEEIDTIGSQVKIIKEASESYDSLLKALTAADENTSTKPDTTVIKKYAIPNLLYKILQVIPKQVQITSIQNTEDTHIVIKAQAEKYEQLGYFKAVLMTDSILLNVTSDTSYKSGNVVYVTIEGDLP